MDVGIIATQAFNGLSLFSILLLMALGLAIVFGLMGVINLAHGEFMMIGAYVTYVTQLFFAHHLKFIFNFYIFIALILSFFLTAFIGLLAERFLIQYLYKRPLDTLLATWGLSLILQQSFRNIFGANNVNVDMPSWLIGSLNISTDFSLPYNRLFIFFLSVLCVIGIFLFLFKTRWGLKIRAVTQNRNMSSALGINVRRVDSLAFAIGSGLAGIAGCALTMIGSVGPSTGQNYIVDSFMVVILGGIQSLIGTILSAFTIAEIQSIGEFFSSSSMAKAITLIAIIVLLQIRPKGLFIIRVRS
ncbi:urea ABC transporter permease subunit UrtB [Thermodesulfatator indicus]